MDIHLKTPEELAIMREAGRIVAQAHEAMRQAIRPRCEYLGTRPDCRNRHP